jgi:histidinol-phosphate/aromatic aminotransferase/cobyric acid decarboxylase-like protein
VVPAARDHGGDGARVARALGVAPDALLDLSLTLNPDAPDVRSIAARHLDALGWYPDGRAATDALAAALGVGPERVLITNGGAEAIALVCADLAVGDVDPCDFSLYRRHLVATRPGAPRVRSNPHNPTGRLALGGERAAVWDEAFYPLATGRWTRGDDDATVVGSLTKTFACPGLRLGYVVADGATIARLGRRQPRWSVNALALAVLPDLLERADLPGWRDAIAARRRDLAAALPGVVPSEAPFALVEAPEGAAQCRARLARRGVLVRDCTSFGLPTHVRVAIPDDSGRRRLVEAWRP